VALTAPITLSVHRDFEVLPGPVSGFFTGIPTRKWLDASSGYAAYFMPLLEIAGLMAWLMHYCFAQRSVCSIETVHRGDCPVLIEEGGS